VRATNRAPLGTWSIQGWSVDTDPEGGSGDGESGGERGQGPGPSAAITVDLTSASIVELRRLG
jgi:hypothetical protein